MENKQRYKINILEARRELREGKNIVAYETLGDIMDNMEIEEIQVEEESDNVGDIVEEIYTKEKVIEILEEVMEDSQRIHDNKSFEDYGQIINQCGQMEVLEVIGVIRDKLNEIKEDEVDKNE